MLGIMGFFTEFREGSMAVIVAVTLGDGQADILGRDGGRIL
jgi:hypothetical protein